MNVNSRIAQMFLSVWPLLVLALGVTVLSVGFSAASDVFEPTVTIMLIHLTIVIGLYIFIGNSGVISFGHMGFLAIGAYTWALLTIPIVTKDVFLPRLPAFLASVELPSDQAAVIGGLVAAAFALVVGIPVMRMSGISASIATFAVLVIVRIIASNWVSITRGRSSMVGMPYDASVLKSLVWTLIAMTTAFAFQRSRYGLRLRASRDDEVAARAVGIGIYVERICALVVSAFFVGVAGGLWGGFLGAFNPDAFYLSLTIMTLAMLVVGGINSLAGAVVGTVTISVLSEFLRRAEQGIDLGVVQVGGTPGMREVALAVLMLVVLIFRSNGITGSQEVPWPSFWPFTSRSGRSGPRRRPRRDSWRG